MNSINKNSFDQYRLTSISLVNCAIAMLVLFLSGCGSSQETVEYLYGKKGEAGYTKSVNGTRIFAKMFEQRGYRVKSRSKATPTMGNADTVVWFPDTYQPPSKEVMDTLQQWLDAEPDRVLVYVGRDYDAETPFWEFSLENALPDQLETFRRNYAAAKLRELRRITSIPGTNSMDNIEFKKLASPRQVINFTGKLADGTVSIEKPIVIRQSLSWDDSQARRYTYDYAGPEVLLEASGIPLVTSVPTGNYEDSRIILVSNGSFLLNYPLTDPKNRKIAVKLLEEIESINDQYQFDFFSNESERHAIFLESDVEVRESDQPEAAKTIWDWIKIAPFNFIIPHFAILAVVACCYMFPIFGRPKRSDFDSPYDFGKHITAYAEMLEKTGNKAYAQELVDSYRTQKNRARVHWE